MSKAAVLELYPKAKAINVAHGWRILSGPTSVSELLGSGLSATVAWGNALWNIRRKAEQPSPVDPSSPHDGKTPCPPESRCTVCWPHSALSADHE